MNACACGCGELTKRTFVAGHNMRALDLEARFWAKVTKGAADECWLWTGSLSVGGYGHVRRQNRSRNAHAIAWEIANKQSVPAGLVVRHTCDNPPCCNPAHLLVGTAADNYQDAVERGRRPRNQFALRDACSKGHSYTPENTYLRMRDGVLRRVCRTCTRAYRAKSDGRA